MDGFYAMANRCFGLSNARARRRELKIARRFNAGFHAAKQWRPRGTPEIANQGITLFTADDLETLAFLTGSTPAHSFASSASPESPLPGK
jgi:hypothetical protein